MKNTFKKFGFVLAVSALLFAGASTLYAGPNLQLNATESERQRYLDINSGGSDY